MRSVRRHNVQVLCAENVRATGEGVYTPRRTHSGCYYVRANLCYYLGPHYKRQKIYHSVTTLPKDFSPGSFLIYLTRTWSTSLLSTNRQMYELMLLGFHRHAVLLILDDAFVDF